MNRIKEITEPLLVMLEDCIYRYTQLSIAVPFVELPRVFVRYYTLQRNIVRFIEDRSIDMVDIVNRNKLLQMKEDFMEVMNVLLEESEFNENCYLETSYEVRDMYKSIESLVNMKMKNN
jgi:hypothetical protein